MAAQTRSRARQQARVLLASGRSRSTARRRWACRRRRAKVHVAIAAWPWGAYLGAEGAREGHPRQDLVVRAPPRQRDDVRAPSSPAPTPIRSSPTRKRRSTATTRRLLLDVDGFVAEGSGENLFIVKNGRALRAGADLGAGRHHPRFGDHARARPRARGRAQAPDPRRRLHRRRGVLHRHRRRGARRSASSTIAPIGSGERGPITRKLQTLFFDAVLGKNAEVSILAHRRLTRADECDKPDAECCRSHGSRPAAVLPEPRDAAVVEPSPCLSRRGRHRRGDVSVLRHAVPHEGARRHADIEKFIVAIVCRRRERSRPGPTPWLNASCIVAPSWIGDAILSEPLLAHRCASC